MYSSSVSFILMEVIFAFYLNNAQIQNNQIKDEETQHSITFHKTLSELWSILNYRLTLTFWKLKYADNAQ